MKVLLMLLAMTAYADDKSGIDDTCLEKELKACGDEKLPAKGPLTPEQSKVLICRLTALTSCMKKEEVEP